MISTVISPVRDSVDVCGYITYFSTRYLTLIVNRLFCRMAKDLSGCRNDDRSIGENTPSGANDASSPATEWLRHDIVYLWLFVRV